MLGSTRLDAYYLDTGESLWWMPIGSGGSLGTPISAGGSLFVSTLGSTEPYMPTFQAVLATYDKRHDGRLSRDEFKGGPDLGEHFGWIDTHGDNFISGGEWEVARNSLRRIRRHRHRSRRPTRQTGRQRGPLALQEESALRPGPTMVRTGGIITADNKLYLANADGKITVLKAGAGWEVLAVNDLDDEIHAPRSERRPDLRANPLYLYCFGARR